MLFLFRQYNYNGKAVQMVYKKFFRAGAAAVLAAAVLALGGCSVKFGTNNRPRSSDVMAKPSSSGYGKDMEITYGEFEKRYLYSLKGYGIEDDEAESVAEACKGYRQSIIDNLISNKIFLQKAKEMGLDTLSDDEMSIVTEEYNSQIQSLEQQYGKEGFDEMLKECSLTRDDLLDWLVTYTVSLNVADRAVSDAVSYSEAEEMAKSFMEEAKTLYSDDTEKYIQKEYYRIWVPDGARMIKHIVMNFDEETAGQIKALREEGRDSAADSLRDEKAGELAENVSSIRKMLDNGEEYFAVLLMYADNAAAASLLPNGYLLTPNDPSYDDEFKQAAFGMGAVGDITSYADDSGVNVLIYAADAAVSDEDIKSFTDIAYSQLKANAYSMILAEWYEEFNYEIDYEKMRLDAPEA